MEAALSTRTILAFLFDEENTDKMWINGIGADQARQVLDNRPRVEANRKGRRGLYLVIGRDDHGQCVAIPVEPTPDPETWRPITAWPCKRSEEARLR